MVLAAVIFETLKDAGNFDKVIVLSKINKYVQNISQLLLRILIRMVASCMSLLVFKFLVFFFAPFLLSM